MVNDHLAAVTMTLGGEIKESRMYFLWITVSEVVSIPMVVARQKLHGRSST